MVLLAAGRGRAARRGGIGELHRTTAVPVAGVAGAGGVGICARARVARSGSIEFALAGRRTDVIELAGFVFAAARAGRQGPAGGAVLDTTGLAGVVRVDCAVGVASLIDRAAVAHDHASTESEIAQPRLASRGARDALARLRATRLFTVAFHAVRTGFFAADTAACVAVVIGRARIPVVTDALCPRDEFAARGVARETGLAEWRAAVANARRAIDTAGALCDALVPAAESTTAAGAALDLLAAAVVDRAAFEGRFTLGFAGDAAAGLPCIARLRDRLAAAAG